VVCNKSNFVNYACHKDDKQALFTRVDAAVVKLLKIYTQWLAGNRRLSGGSPRWPVKDARLTG
jgi:hypothetical protein